MSALNGTRTPSHQSTTQSPFSNRLAHLLKVALNPTLPTEARLLYVILCLMAWSKGYCFPSQTTQAEGLGRSERQVRRLLKTLEQAKLLQTLRGGNRPTRYYPVGVQPEDTCGQAQDTGGGEEDRGDRRTPKENVQDVKNVLPETPVTTPKPKPKPKPKTNVNAFQKHYREPRKSFSPRPNHRDELVREIEQVTGDTWSTGWFHTLVRNNDQQTVRMALSITRDKMAQDSGVNGGAYFTATIKGLRSCQSCTQEPTKCCYEEKPPQPKPKAVLKTVPQPEEAFYDDADLFNPDNIIKGLRLQGRTCGLDGLLLWAERSLPYINCREIFTQIQEIMPDKRREDLMEHFLQTVHVRLKHQQKRTDCSQDLKGYPQLSAP